MADPTAVLGLLWTVATGIYDRVGDYRIGMTDLQFQLARYRTYTTVEEKAKLDQGLRNKSCHATAERLYQLHAAVGKWLASNNFKVKRSGKVHAPFTYSGKRAASFKDIVDVIAKESDQLMGELKAQATPVLPFAALEAPEDRDALIHPAAVTRTLEEITAVSAKLGVTEISPDYANT